MIRHLLLVLFAAFLTLPASGAEKPLIVGMELSFPPFEMLDKEGKPAGVSVELAKALAKELNRELKIENIPFDGLIPSLKTGKIDLILSSMTANDERRRSIDFSDPYCHTGLCILLGKNSGVTGIEDLDQKGKKIAVKQGTTGQLYASKQIKNAEVLVFNREDAAVLEVAQGKADAFIYDQIAIYQNWLKHKETTKPILKPFQEESWAAGIRKGNDELRNQVNSFFAKFKAEGGFDRLGDQFMKEQKETLNAMGYPFLF